MPSQPKPSAVAAMVTEVAIVLVPTIVASPILGILGLGGAGVAAGQYQSVPTFVMYRLPL